MLTDVGRTGYVRMIVYCLGDQLRANRQSLFMQNAYSRDIAQKAKQLLMKRPHVFTPQLAKNVWQCIWRW